MPECDFMAVSDGTQTTQRTPQATRLGVLAILGPIVAFSLMNSIVKLTRVAALPFAFYRLWMGAVVMLLVLSLSGRRLTLATLRRAVPGGVLFGANLCFFFSALKLTSVADVLIVAALQPALTLLVAGPLFGERVTVHEVTWTAVSLSGVVLVILGSSGTPVWSLEGDLLAVGALFAWTIYWLVSKRVRRDLQALDYMTAVTVTAAVVVTPVALLSGESFSVRWEDWLWLLLFVAGAQGGHSILAWSHAQVDVTISSLLILAEPVISVVAALLILGEPLPALSIAGGLVTVVAVGMVTRRATRAAKEETVPEEVAPA
jgi:drug/metabolite transporter (DMT)-like permease